MDAVTLDSLKARFGELLLTRLTDDNGLGVIDEVKVAAAIQPVLGKVESAVSGRYPWPLTVIAPELAKAAEDLTLEGIYSGKPERETPKDVKDRAATADAWLFKVKAGTATLSAPPPIAASADVAAASGPNMIRTVAGTSPISSTLERY